MKIIHTSDWHLGHSLYGYGREEEQRGMLSRIGELILSEKPDALVVSGDIYHNAQPSAAVQRLFTDSVLRFHRDCPDMVIVITAGNHDSASRHEVTRVLWETQRVYMIGQTDREDAEAQIVEVPDKGWIVAVPYMNDRKVPEGFYQGLLDRVAEKNAAGLPVVLSAHLTVRGGDFRGHDDARDFSVGGIDSIGISELGTGYDYAALGHIHCAQTLQESGGRVRYCGAPVPVSFDENCDHGVSVVEIAAHGALPQIRAEIIRNPRPLVTLPAEGFAGWDEVKALASEFRKDSPAYVRLNVAVDDFLPADAKEEALSIFSEGQARFCLINAQRRRQGSSAPAGMTVNEFHQMEPIDAVRRLAESQGIVFGEEFEKMFREAERAVREDDARQKEEGR